MSFPWDALSCPFLGMHYYVLSFTFLAGGQLAQVQLLLLSVTTCATADCFFGIRRVSPGFLLMFININVDVYTFVYVYIKLSSVSDDSRYS